jgi:hypothetical protein
MKKYQCLLRTRRMAQCSFFLRKFPTSEIVHSMGELLWCEMIPFGMACLLLRDCGYGVADGAIFA